MGELVAAAVFALIGLFSVGPRLSADATRAFWSALIPLLVVLLQGGGYWLLARRRIGTGEPMPEGQRRAYRVLRVADPLLFAVGALGVVVWWPSSASAAVLCVAVWVFGVVEYVNYFVVRLAYPPGQWFHLVGRRRVPRLVRELH